MNSNLTPLTRRRLLGNTGLLLAAALSAPKNLFAASPAPAGGAQTLRPFLFCLNTSTIRGQNLGIVKEIEVTAQAGYDAIEPWINSIETYVRNGGTLSDLKKKLSDSGVSVESVIGFSEWLVENETRRAAGLEQAKYQMDIVAQIGGKRLACPPTGATNLPKVELAAAAERYRALLQIGDTLGVVPELELWGHSRNLGQLGECVAVIVQSGHPKACILADVFHLYKGGSDFHGLKLLGPTAVQVIHMNDYPADPPRATISDGARIYPGDGTAPLPELLRILKESGGQKTLSLELFNRAYWSQDPLIVAKTGLEKMKKAAEAA